MEKNGKGTEFSEVFSSGGIAMDAANRCVLTKKRWMNFPEERRKYIAPIVGNDISRRRILVLFLGNAKNLFRERVDDERL